MPTSPTRVTSSATGAAASPRRDQIVAAAFQRIAADGIAGLRMRDVAAEAGVNIATVHYYLTSKEELIHAVVEHAHSQFAAHAAAPALPEPKERLRAHLDAVFDLLDRDPALARVLAEIAVASAHDGAVFEVVVTAETRWRRELQSLLHPLSARDARSIAALVMLVAKGACLPPADATTMRDARCALDDLLGAKPAVASAAAE